jgi:hypothetical protein
MKTIGPVSRPIAIATLLCFAAPQAEAIELYGTGTAATQLDDGLLIQVRGGRGGGGARHGGGGMHRGGGMHHGGGMHRGGGMHHGMNRGNFNRGAYAHRGNFHGAHANRNINRNVNRNVNRSVNRNVNVNRGVYRAGYWGNWARPGRYYWPVGGAVAAGAALGFVSAAAAASWAGAAPGPNLCWYYTDPSRRAGFWDACP